MIISIMRACHMYYMNYGNQVTKGMRMTLWHARMMLMTMPTSVVCVI